MGARGQATELANVAEQFSVARGLIMKDSLSYGEFKHKCDALRLYVFAGVFAYCAQDLIRHPLKSSYFYTNWSPLSLPGKIVGTFSGNKGSIFHEEATNSPAPDLAKQLVMKRRLE